MQIVFQWDVPLYRFYRQHAELTNEESANGGGVGNVSWLLSLPKIKEGKNKREENKLETTAFSTAIVCNVEN